MHQWMREGQEVRDAEFMVLVNDARDEEGAELWCPCCKDCAFSEIAEFLAGHHETLQVRRLHVVDGEHITFYGVMHDTTDKV